MKPLVLPVLLALAGCGYATGSLVPEQYTTIAVPVFDNATHRHDLEWELTRDVVEEIQARTKLRVVAPDQSPDLVLKGAVANATEEVLAYEENQRIRESAYFLAADVEVVDARTGHPLVTKRRVTERESYVPKIGETVRTAREEAGRALAERIVQQLETAW